MWRYKRFMPGDWELCWVEYTPYKWTQPTAVQLNITLIMFLLCYWNMIQTPSCRYIPPAVKTIPLRCHYFQPIFPCKFTKLLCKDRFKPPNCGIWDQLALQRQCYICLMINVLLLDVSDQLCLHKCSSIEHPRQLSIKLLFYQPTIHRLVVPVQR